LSATISVDELLQLCRSGQKPEIVGARGRAILHEHLRRVLAKVIQSSMKQEPVVVWKRSRQISADLISEYVASTFVLVLNWWLDKKMFSTPKEINDLFHNLVSPTLGAACR